jgi:peptide-methionine (S)-S-oxide reductase
MIFGSKEVGMKTFRILIIVLLAAFFACGNSEKGSQFAPQAKFTMAASQFETNPVLSGNDYNRGIFALPGSQFNHGIIEKQQKIKHMDTAYFASGCFWCAEAVFRNLKGVKQVLPGYMGGHKDRPTYEEVCTGRTGHAEAVEIIFDPDSITYNDLLEIFWNTHDPTTLNRQGNDIGTQYRSAIFYLNDEQQRIAEASLKEYQASGALDKPIVTVIEAAGTFWTAEEYHWNYFSKHPDQAYCQAVIRPKMEKFRKLYKEKLRTTE